MTDNVNLCDAVPTPRELPPPPLILPDGRVVATPLSWDRCPNELSCAGFRRVVATEQPQAGFRVTRYAIVELDPYTCSLAIAEQIDVVAEAAAAEAAAAALRAVPIVYDRPIQARIETPATDGHIYGIEIDPDSGDVISVQRESVRLADAEYATARAAKLAARKAARDAAKAGKDDGNWKARVERIERLLRIRA